MHVDLFVPVVTFDVHIKSTFVPDWTYDVCRTGGNLLSLQLTCYVPYHDGMRCRTEKYKKILLSTSYVPSKEVSFSSLTDRFIRPDSFDQPGAPFEILFDDNGIVAYAVNNTDVQSMRMNNVYRMIANLMSIGISRFDNKGDFFTAMERSTVGYCPTNYTIRKYPSIKRKILSKKFLPYYPWQFREGESVLITKQRELGECTKLSHYSFGVRFWPNFTSASNVTEYIRKSINFMTLDDDTLESMTENSFDLHDEEENTIGFVVEVVILKLTSVNLRSKYDQFGQYGVRMTHMLDVFNNDKI